MTIDRLNIIQTTTTSTINKAKTNNVENNTANTDIKLNNSIPNQDLNSQIGLTRTKQRMLDVVSMVETYAKDMKSTILDTKYLTEGFKYGNSYFDRMRDIVTKKKANGNANLNIAQRIDKSSSLNTDLFMAELYQFKDSPEVKEELTRHGIVMDDIEQSLAYKFKMCIDENWFEGRKDYMEYFLSSDAGAKAVDDLLLSKHAKGWWVMGDISGDYTINQRRKHGHPDIHKSFGETQEVASLLFTSDKISKKNKKVLLDNIRNLFVVKALCGDLLYHSTEHDWLKQERDFQKIHFNTVSKNNIDINGFDIDFKKQINSSDFFENHVGLKYENGSFSAIEGKHTDHFILAGLCNAKYHLNDDIREALTKYVNSEEFIKSKEGGKYFRYALKFGNGDLVHSFISALEPDKLKDGFYKENKIGGWELCWAHHEHHLGDENFEKIETALAQLANDNGFYVNGVTQAQSVFRNIYKAEAIRPEVLETYAPPLGEYVFSNLKVDSHSGADIESTAGWHKIFSKDYENESSLSSLTKALKKYTTLSHDAIHEYASKVIANDIENFKEDGNLNQMLNLTRTMEFLGMDTSEFRQIAAEKATSYPELVINKPFFKDILAKQKPIPENWNFDFLDPVVEYFNTATQDIDNPIYVAHEYIKDLKTAAQSFKENLDAINSGENIQANMKTLAFTPASLNTVLKQVGTAFIEADRKMPHSYLPALYMIDSVDDSFKAKIEEIYDKSNTIRKANFIAKMRSLSPSAENLSKIEEMESKLIDSCESSEHLNTLIVAFNRNETYSYSQSTINKLVDKVENDENLVWNLHKEDKESFIASLKEAQGSSVLRDKALLVAAAQQLNSDKESIELLSKDLIASCSDSDDLNFVLEQLNQNSDFKYTAEFREVMREKIFRDESFEWKVGDQDVTNFKKSFPVLFNKLNIDTLDLIGYSESNCDSLATCETKLEHDTDTDGNVKLHILRNGERFDIATITKNRVDEYKTFQDYTVRSPEREVDNIYISVAGKWGHQGSDYFRPGDYLKVDNEFYYCHQAEGSEDFEFITVNEQNLDRILDLSDEHKDFLSPMKALGYVVDSERVVRDGEGKFINFGFSYDNEELSSSNFQPFAEKMMIRAWERAINSGADMKSFLDTDLVENIETLKYIDTKKIELKIAELVLDNLPKTGIPYGKLQKLTREGRMYPDTPNMKLNIFKDFEKVEHLAPLLNNVSDSMDLAEDIYKSIYDYHNYSKDAALDLLNVESEKMDKMLDQVGDIFAHIDDAGNVNYTLPLFEGVSDKFQAKLDQRFAQAMVPTKASYVATLQGRANATEYPKFVESYRKREKEMVESCTSSDMLHDLLIELNDHEYELNQKFIDLIAERTSRDDFHWNMDSYNQEIFMNDLNSGQVPIIPPALNSEIKANGEMSLQQYISGQAIEIGTLVNNGDTFTLNLADSAKSLNIGINGMAVENKDESIDLKPGSFLRIDSKLFYVAENSSHSNDETKRYELLQVSNKASLIEDLFFENGEIRVSQHGLPECMQLSALIIALINDSNGDKLRDVLSGISPDVNSKGEVVFSIRFAGNAPDSRINGLDTKRIVIPRDQQHGLREEDGQLVVTEFAYYPDGEDDGVAIYKKRHASGVPGISLLSFALSEVDRRTSLAYNINQGLDGERTHITHRLTRRTAAELLGFKFINSSDSNNGIIASLQSDREEGTTVDGAIARDFSTQREKNKFIKDVKTFLKDSHSKVLIGTKVKTLQDPLRAAGKPDPADYSNCSWDQKHKFFERDGHYLTDHHALSLSLDKDDNFVINCPHNSLVPFNISDDELLEYASSLHYFAIEERRLFMENRLPRDVNSNVYASSKSQV